MHLSSVILLVFGFSLNLELSVLVKHQIADLAYLHMYSEVIGIDTLIAMHYWENLTDLGASRSLISGMSFNIHNYITHVYEFRLQDI